MQIHDLRRSLASWQSINGVSLPIISRTLNHKSFASTQIYARLHIDPVKEAMELAVGSMFEAMGEAMPKSRAKPDGRYTVFPQFSKTVEKEERTCQQCGIKYQCRKRSKSMYCRLSCKQAAKRKPPKFRQIVKGNRRCNYCGESYQFTTALSKYWSAACNTKMQNLNRLKRQLKENRHVIQNITIWQDGLGIRENKNGPSSYLCKTRFNGEQVLFTLGKADTLSLKEAQELAKRAQLHSQIGIDPRNTLKSQEGKS